MENREERALVFYGDKEVGDLIKKPAGYEFAYKPEYLKSYSYLHGNRTQRIQESCSGLYWEIDRFVGSPGGGLYPCRLRIGRQLQYRGDLFHNGQRHKLFGRCQP